MTHIIPKVECDPEKGMTQTLTPEIPVRRILLSAVASSKILAGLMKYDNCRLLPTFLPTPGLE